jgi:hypothetical protein
MFRIARIAASIFLCGLVFTGCDNDGETPAGPSPQPSPSPTPTPTPTPQPQPPAPLPAPGALTLSAAACSPADTSSQRANLSWTASTNAANYRVERRVWSTGLWESTGLPVTALVFTETVSNSNDYYYRVTALNATGATVATPNPIRACVAQGPPRIEFTFVPRKGSTDNLTGRVLRVDPALHKVIVYIKVQGRWWSKPVFGGETTTIRSDGTWVTDITTGGVDETADEIAAFLVTSGHQPRQMGGESQNLPVEVNGRDVLDLATRTR